jgi:pimeloyl-ACP methyl ester carboxylesterase
MKKATHAPKKRWATLFLISATTAAIGASFYHYLSQKERIELKTNQVQTILASKDRYVPALVEAAQVYLFNKYLPTWKKGVKPSLSERREHKRVLKYKPHIEHIVDLDPAIVVNHRRPTLFLHGWGDTKHSAKLLKAYCDVLPGDVVTFNFRDQGVIIPKLRCSNLGQLPDVLSALFTLKWMKDTLQIDEVDLCGYSRGGATLLNMICVLHDASGAYDYDLARIGIDAQERAALLRMIERGCHVLNCPLTDANVTIESRMKNTKWINLFEQFTKYKRNGLQGLRSAQGFAGLRLNMLIHFQHNDRIVSNLNEAELYYRLATHNPKDTYIVLGDNGGHLHSHAALAHTIHAFKKKYGSSYDPRYVSQYYDTLSNHDLANRLLQPGNQAEQIIDAFHEQCTAYINK